EEMGNRFGNQPQRPRSGENRSSRAAEAGCHRGARATCRRAEAVQQSGDGRNAAECGAGDGSRSQTVGGEEHRQGDQPRRGRVACTNLRAQITMKEAYRTGESKGASVASVTVVGLGYVGLPTAALLANAGIEVFGMDVDERIVADLQSGARTSPEPEVKALVERGLALGRLHVDSAVRQAEAYVVCVPTPIRADRTADLSFVDAAM